VASVVWVAIGLAIFQQFVGINIIFYFGEVLWIQTSARDLSDVRFSDTSKIRYPKSCCSVASLPETTSVLRWTTRRKSSSSESSRTGRPLLRKNRLAQRSNFC